MKECPRCKEVTLKKVNEFVVHGETTFEETYEAFECADCGHYETT